MFIIFHFILFFILFYFLFYFILFYFLFYFILFSLFYFILFYLVLFFYFILFYFHYSIYFYTACTNYLHGRCYDIFTGLSGGCTAGHLYTYNYCGTFQMCCYSQHQPVVHATSAPTTSAPSHSGSTRSVQLFPCYPYLEWTPACFPHF